MATNLLWGSRERANQPRSDLVRSDLKSVAENCHPRLAAQNVSDSLFKTGPVNTPFQH